MAVIHTLQTVRVGLGAALISIFICLAAPAGAQMQSREAIALQNQILELRHDLQGLQDQIAAGQQGGSVLGSRPPPPAPRSGGAPSDLVASLLDRVAQLEDQVRALRGRVDEVANQTQQQGEDLGKQIGDLGFRVQTLEGGGGGPPPARTGAAAAASLSPPPASLGTIPAPLAAPPPAALPPRTPELAMQQGNAALARRDYATAEADAREVIAMRGPRSYDAQFLLAQALTGKRDYQQAAVAYDDTYNRSRTGARAADSLLGLANALAMIGEKRASCDTLVKMRGEFPTLREDQRDAVAAVRLRAGCA
jgi:TolA-binding protein